MTKVRILHILDSINPALGGTVESVRQMATALAASGTSVEIASGDPADNQWLGNWSIPVHSLGPSWTFYRYAPKLVSWLKANSSRYDAIIVNGLWRHPSAAAWISGIATKVPYFIVPHGMLDPWFNQADRLKYFRKLFFWSTLEQRAVAKARAILFTCEEERLLAGKSFKPYSPRAEAVAGLGIAIPAGLGEGPQPISFKFPVLEGRRYILFLGRIDPKKGCELLIQAFSEVPNDCTLVIAGPDSCGLSPRLRELASALGISDRVVFTGPLYGPDKWSALRNAELFVLPSFQEAFPVACLEALSVGLPILTTRGVNIWREIEEGGASIVTEATLAGIRSGLERWFCLPAPLRNEMASNAKFLFDSKYEVSRAAMNQYRVIERHL